MNPPKRIGDETLKDIAARLPHPPASLPPVSSPRSRVIEDCAFGAGVVVLVTFALVEAALKIGIHFGKCQHTDSGTPWGLLIVGALLVAPKMVGRATAGSVWRAIGDRIAGRPPVLPPPTDNGGATDGGEP